VSGGSAGDVKYHSGVFGSGGLTAIATIGFRGHLGAKDTGLV